MNKEEKDRLCEHGTLKYIEDRNNVENQPKNIINRKPTLKRTESEMDEGQEDINVSKENEDVFNEFQQQHKNRRGNKTLRTDSFFQGRTITSSTYIRNKTRNDTTRHLQNEEREKRTNRENDKTDNYQLIDMEFDNNETTTRNEDRRMNQMNEDIDRIKENDRITIFKQAMKFAIDEKFPPIKFQCLPALNNDDEGATIVKGFLKHIETKFKKVNPRFKQPSGFEHYMIDNNGDLLCFINTIELFIFMCDTNNYPDSIYSTKIRPSLPSKLPAKHTTIIKFIGNSIGLDQIRTCIKEKLKSVYSIQEMMGIVTYRSRHIRIDLLSADEYTSVLCGGKLVVKGHLYDVDEYLPAPRILICNKCNTSGHSKKNCKSPIVICQRCRKDRNDETDHKACQIKCHHCDGKHESTNYKCPIIMKFRKELINQLKKNTHLLPPHLQFYIPQQLRDQRGIRRLMNDQNNNYQLIHGQQEEWISNTQDMNSWRTLNSNSTSLTTADKIRTPIWNNELKNLYEELEKIKQENEIKVKMIKDENEKQMQKMIQFWNLTNMQIKTQAEAVSDVYNVISETLPHILHSIQMITHIIKENCGNGSNDEERKQKENIFISVNDIMNSCNNRLSLFTDYQRKLKLLMIKQDDLLLQGMGIINLTSNEQ